MGLTVYLLLALMLGTAAGWATTKYISECEGRDSLRSFWGPDVEKTYVDITMPCEFPAVRQKCGSVYISVALGQTYFHGTYGASSMQVAVRDSATNSLLWEGRCDSDKALKYIQSPGREPFPFKKTGGSMDTYAFWNVSPSGTRPVRIAERRKRQYFLEFAPADPQNRRSRWRYWCVVDNEQEVLTPYPDQLCDASEAILDRTKQLGFDNYMETVLYDVFTDADFVQNDYKCQQVTKALTDSATCPEYRRKEAITRCYQIFVNTDMATCIVTYYGGLVDAFTECVRYVCSNYSDKRACKTLGFATYMCDDIPVVTDELEKDNCIRKKRKSTLTLSRGRYWGK